jgi:hypothetical protein
MDAASALMNTAQLGVSLTGFAGLLIAFRFGRSWKRAEIFSLKFLFRSSIGAFILGLLPLPMMLAGVMNGALWSVCFALLGFWTLTLVLFALRARSSGELRPRFKFVYWGLTLSGVATGVLQLVAMLNLYGLRQPAVYMVGLYWLLIVATFQLMMQVMYSLDSIDAD